MADLNASWAGNSATVQIKEECEASTTVRIKEECEASTAVRIKEEYEASTTVRIKEEYEASTTVRIKEECEASTSVRIKKEFEGYSDDGKKELPEQPWAQVETSHEPGQSLTKYEVKIETIQGDDVTSACDNEEFATYISKHEDYERDALSVTGGVLVGSVCSPDSERWYNSEDTLIKAQRVDEDDQTRMLVANHKDCDDCEDTLINAQCVDEDTKTQVLDANPKDCDDGEYTLIEAKCVYEDDKTQVLDANPTEWEDKAKSGHVQRSNPGVNGCRREKAGDNRILINDVVKKRIREFVLRQPDRRTGLVLEPTSTGTGPADIFKATPGLPTDKRKHVSATPAVAQDSGLDKHQCKVCGNQFSQPIFLACHLKFSHGDIGMAPTRETPKSDAFKLINRFLDKEKNNTAINCHKESTHSGNACKSLDINNTVSEAGYLTVNKETVHMGGKRFVCDQCEKAFMTNSQLTRHKRTHSGAKPYVCDQCGRAFSESGNLVVHKRMHTDEKQQKRHECDHCGKAYRRASELITHNYIHTGEKPYGCDQCGKAFISKNNLKSHSRKHSGEQPYLCVQCGKAFSHCSNRAKHVREKHKHEKPL